MAVSDHTHLYHTHYYHPCISQAGWTPLHTAAQKGNTDIVTLLLSEGADVNAKNDVSIVNTHCYHPYHHHPYHYNYNHHYHH